MERIKRRNGHIYNWRGRFLTLLFEYINHIKIQKNVDYLLITINKLDLNNIYGIQWETINGHILFSKAYKILNNKMIQNIEW